jgi:hypothetical protein
MSRRALGAKPTCAVCRQPVEQLLEERDEFLGRVVFTAVCHGQRERVRVDEEALEDARSVGFGVAFASSPRQLAEPPSALPPTGDE